MLLSNAFSKWSIYKAQKLDVELDSNKSRAPEYPKGVQYIVREMVQRVSKGVCERCAAQSSIKEWYR